MSQSWAQSYQVYTTYVDYVILLPLSSADVSLGFSLRRGRAPRRPHMRPHVVPTQTGVRVPRSLARFERPVLTDEPHVLRKAGIVAVH